MSPPANSSERAACFSAAQQSSRICTVHAAEALHTGGLHLYLQASKNISASGNTVDDKNRRHNPNDSNGACTCPAFPSHKRLW